MLPQSNNTDVDPVLQLSALSPCATKQLHHGVAVTRRLRQNAAANHEKVVRLRLPTGAPRQSWRSLSTWVLPVPYGQMEAHRFEQHAFVSPSLPEHVVRFIQHHIHSVLQLEVLLLLRSRGGAWTPASVASELRITEQSAELRLQDLHLRGLLSLDAAARSYAYAPQLEESRAPVDALAECYAMMRYTVINMIFSVPGDSARTLAEAFRFRKRRED